MEQTKQRLKDAIQKEVQKHGYATVSTCDNHSTWDKEEHIAMAYFQRKPVELGLKDVNITSKVNYGVTDWTITGTVPPQYIQVCGKCGSEEVARCKWVNVNNDKIYSEDSGTTLEWCFNCIEETRIVDQNDFRPKDQFGIRKMKAGDEVEQTTDNEPSCENCGSNDIEYADYNEAEQHNEVHCLSCDITFDASLA